MSDEKPALGVMKLWEYDSAVAYEAKCVCGNDDHNLQFFVEIDECDEVVLNFYTKVSTDYWTDHIKIDTLNIENPVLYSAAVTMSNFVNSIARKLKLTYNIWCDGYVNYEQSLIMGPKQSSIFANTILDAIKGFKK